MWTRVTLQLLLLLAANSLQASSITFLCYDPLIKKTGHYELKSDVIEYLPTELSFQPDTKTVTKKTATDWQCQNLNWGDPYVYFFCHFTNNRNELVISVDLFDRNTSRYVSEAVSPADFFTFYEHSEVGQNSDAKINLPFDECFTKSF